LRRPQQGLNQRRFHTCERQDSNRFGCGVKKPLQNSPQADEQRNFGAGSKLRAMSDEIEDNERIEDNESLRARSEQAIGELAQALLDSQVLENAVAAAFGAREKAVEAQHAAMAALNLPAASDLERLERRLRSLSQRLDEIEDLVDGMSRDLNTLRRQANSRQADSPAGPGANSSSNAKSAKGAKSAKASKAGGPKTGG
jgi:hypothetical protein